MAVYRVIDAMDAPHGGRILRLKLIEGDPPSPREVKAGRLEATSPDGRSRCSLRVDGFAVFGGRPSSDRIARTGRLDVRVFPENEDDASKIGLTWEVRAV